MKEIVLTVPDNTKEFIQSSIRWHQMISSFKEDTPNNEIHVLLKEEHSHATEQDLYSGVNLYGLNEQVVLSPKGLAHIARLGAPELTVSNYVMSIKNSHTQESVLEALNEEGIKYNFHFWFGTIPTARSLELMIAMGSNPSSALSQVMNLYKIEQDEEYIDLIQIALKNGAMALLPTLCIPSFLPTNVIELLIENGLKVESVFRASSESSSPEGQLRLLKIAQGHGFSIKEFDNNYFPSLNNFTADFIDLIISNNIVPVQKILQKIIQLTPNEYSQEKGEFIKSQSLIDKQETLIKHTASKGAELQKITFCMPEFVQNHLHLIIDLCGDFNSFPWNLESLTKEQIELLVEKGLDPNTLAKTIYDLALPKHNHQINTYETATINIHFEELVAIAVSKGLKFNDYFTEQLSKKISYILPSGKMVPATPSIEILNLLNKSKLINADVMFQCATRTNDLDLLKESIKEGASIDNATELLNELISGGNHKFAEYFVTALGISTIDPRAYINGVLSSNVKISQDMITKFVQFFDKVACMELMRAAGASISNITIVSDIYDLYCAYGKNSSDLSSFAREVLNPDIELTAKQLHGQDFTNKWGYSALQLAVIAKKLTLAQELVDAGHDIYQANNNKTSTIDLFNIITCFNSGEPSKESEQLANKIASQLKDVDIVDKENGESLADLLISTGSSVAERIIELSNDPLFALYKKSVDLNNLFKDNLTHIAISNGNDFWSTGAWSVARLLMQNYPNVVFHLITLEMVDKAGVDFLDQFDAFINPGANDSYPGHTTFKLEDCPLIHPIEKLYQLVLTKAADKTAPYVGMCAGAQHLVLNYKGTLAPLKGYDHGQHTITYLKGTLPYYMVLTKEQQSQMLKTGVFPEITFKSDTAHHYAAVTGNLGKLTLGAISESGVPMSYSSSIHFATQFHPEHFYCRKDESSINQKAWLNNFVELAIMNHNGEDILGHMKSIHDQMQSLLGQVADESTIDV